VRDLPSSGLGADTEVIVTFTSGPNVGLTRKIMTDANGQARSP